MSGSSVTLTLATTDAVTASQTVTVNYTKGTNPIQDVAGNDAVALSSQSVLNGTGDTTPPTPESATINGATITITFSEPLDLSSIPAGSNFQLSSTDHVPTTVTAVNITNVVTSGLSLIHI